MKRNSGLFRAVSAFLASVAGFGLAVLLYSLLAGTSPLAIPYGLALIPAVLAFWVVIEIRSDGDEISPSVLFMEYLALSMGANLILQALLAYAFDLTLVPLPVLVGGTAIAGGLVLAAREFPLWGAAPRRGFLLIGYDPDAVHIARLANRPVLGVFDAGPSRVPDSMPVLGSFATASLEELTALPARVIIGTRAWCERIPVPLFQLKMSGVPVEDTARLYERTLRRIRYSELSAADLLFSPALKTGRHIMAIQAVYTDLMGLVFLILLVPVMVAAGAALALFGGPGPILERMECLGFQSIPFELMRFRTRDSKTGADTRVGAWLARLHLVNLPQLLNIVRGEMVFFGPRPVRREFAERLGELLPYYYHRFSVKPGVVGWAQVNVPRFTVPPEPLRMEYDFYYIRQGSLALDFEILVRSILGGARQPETGEVTP